MNNQQINRNDKKLKSSKNKKRILIIGSLGLLAFGVAGLTTLTVIRSIDANKNNSSLKSIIENKQSELDEVQNSLIESNDRLSKEQLENKKQITNLNLKLENQTLKLHKLNLELENKSLELQKLNLELDEQNLIITNQILEISKLNSKLEKQIEKVDKTNLEIANLNNLLNKNLETIKLRESEIFNLNLEIQNLKKDKLEQGKEIINLNEQITKITNKNQEERNIANEEINKLKLELLNERKTIDELETKNNLIVEAFIRNIPENQKMFRNIGTISNSSDQNILNVLNNLSRRGSNFFPPFTNILILSNNNVDKAMLWVTTPNRVNTFYEITYNVSMQ
ncbi:hypothetical protein [Mycoplasmoides pirum]|uniref:hypothetical protein n=1 Tax=Mycoplasmoides pirum TaxID=2122 RepID=UPI0004809D93|nr:hypothetical protein [Mycoplasmoides pirum]